MRYDRPTAILSALSKAMNATFIYALSDPRTGEIRYIGKADGVKRRWQAHITCALRPTSSSYNTYAARWIRSLLAVSLRPSFSIIEWVSLDEWEEREQWWIDLFSSIGCALVNTAEGGIGGAGFIHKGMKRSPESIQRMRIAARSRKRTPRGPYSQEHREAIRQGLIRAGVKPPPSAYEKALEVNRGRVPWNLGIKMSTETCRKLSAMRMGNQYTLGHKDSPETLERKRQAQLRRYARKRESGSR